MVLEASGRRFRNLRDVLGIILEGSGTVLESIFGFFAGTGRSGPSFRRVWTRFWIVFLCFFEV